VVGGPADLRQLERGRKATAAVAAADRRQAVLEPLRQPGLVQARVADNLAAVERDERCRRPLQLPLEPLVVRRSLACERHVDLGDRLDAQLVHVTQVRVAQFADPVTELAVPGPELPQHHDLLRDLLEATAVDERERVGVADASPERVAAELARLLTNGREQLRADPAATHLGMHAHHREGAARDARTPDERKAAVVVDEGGPVPVRGLVGRDHVVGLDLVVDLCAALEVRAGVREARHPDRFSFPCFLAYRSPVRKIRRPSGTETAPITSSAQISVPRSVRPAPSMIAARQPRRA
jgi:hypothetical protein